MANDTGLMLSEARGPLNNLLDNLSGVHASYWLTALKKMLRKEEIPEPPLEVLEMMKKLNTRADTIERLEQLKSFFEKIPVVKVVELSEEDWGNGNIMSVGVYPNLIAFIEGENYNGDIAYFTIKIDGTVENTSSSNDYDKDQLFIKWEGDKADFRSHKAFVEALFELGSICKNAIPTTEGLE